MDILSFQLGRSARWLISATYPVSMEFPALDGWTVVNPLVYPKLLGGTRGDNYWDSRVVGLHDGQALVETEAIFFVVDDIDTITLPDPPNPSNDFRFFRREQLPTAAKKFVRRLRFVTKQAGLTTEPGIGFATGTGLEELPHLDFPVASRLGNALVLSYEIDTAIRWDHLRTVPRIDEFENLPVHDSLLLDSINALLEPDYRRALLFAAIAMETFVSTALQQEYEQVISGDPAAERYRVVSFPLPRGETQTKDPIYAHLVERARNEFATKLHELPLYLLGKSVLVENEHLYQAALRLYMARNRIVHTGDITDDGRNSLGLNRVDARTGLETAVEICEWFGMTEHYFVPGDSISLEAAAETSVPS